MKNYELTVLFHPDLEMNLDPAIKKVKEIVEANEGKVAHESNDGKKRLAYKIAEQEFAIYYTFDVELPPVAPAKISNGLSLADEVIRYLLVTVDPRKVKMQAKQKPRKESEENETKESTKEEKK